MPAGVALPGVHLTPEQLPPLPGSGPQPERVTVPAFWQDAGRIAADVLELYARDPQRAKEVWDFARAKLAEINAGK